MNFDIYSKFWGNFEGIWGNPGEIPHIGWKIHGVQRVKEITLMSPPKYVRYNVIIQPTNNIVAQQDVIFMSDINSEKIIPLSNMVLVCSCLIVFLMLFY